MRLYLRDLTLTDPALARAKALEELAVYPRLVAAHRDAVADARDGHVLADMGAHAAELAEAAVFAAEVAVHAPERAEHAARLLAEARGYAMGLTAVVAAVREHAPEELASPLHAADEVALEDGYGYPRRVAA